MKIITVLADSLAMPRKETPLLTSYPILMQQSLDGFYIVNRARRTNTTLEQATTAGAGWLTEDVTHYGESSYFVVHLGICDAAPRLFGKHEYQQYERFGRLGKTIINYKQNHRYEFTRMFPKTYVGLSEFEWSLNVILKTIVQETRAQKTFVINIADTNQDNKSKSYGFDLNLEKYNQAIQRAADRFPDSAMLIDIYQHTKQNPNTLLEDGIHLAPETHKHIADLIVQEIVRNEHADA